jgi:N-acetylglucosaminyldiphosphoundecaprenol N-acetyl-beta-D-mannosaminyltransferase
LLGGKPGVAQSLKRVLENRFPSIQVTGTFTPPFRPLTEREEEQLLTMIKRASPDVIWVGLSTPKQERFMARYASMFDVPLMVGVGAAFDVHTGQVRDAPAWVKRAGMQWLHRITQEPRRLAPRYLENNPQFAWKMSVQLTRRAARRWADSRMGSAKPL